MHRIIKKVKDSPDLYRHFELSLEKRLIPNGAPDLISFVNPFSYMVLRTRPDCYRDVEYYYSDAMVSSMLFSLLIGRRVPRVSFDFGSFARYFLTRLHETGCPVFFIGAKDGAIRQTVENFKHHYPRLNIVGYRHGYFDNDEQRERVADEIVASGAEFVVCGMGTPHQEIFGGILKRKGKGQLKQVFTCGGFLHQSSDRIDYYPWWINKFHLRWLYRAVDESYVIKRLCNQYPRFVISVLLDRFL